MGAVHGQQYLQIKFTVRGKVNLATYFILDTWLL